MLNYNKTTEINVAFTLSNLFTHLIFVPLHLYQDNVYKPLNYMKCILGFWINLYPGTISRWIYMIHGLKSSFNNFRKELKSDLYSKYVLLYPVATKLKLVTLMIF